MCKKCVLDFKIKYKNNPLCNMGRVGLLVLLLKYWVYRHLIFYDNLLNKGPQGTKLVDNLAHRPNPCQ